MELVLAVLLATATPGYIDDKQCATCHSNIARTYQQVGMSKAFYRPRADHQGVLRRVRHECLFCHNAYPEIAAETRDGFWRKQTLPTALPEGLGCQRCHGPGAEHAGLALGSADGASVRAAIVNPMRLDPQHRKDVCYECHMQPAVALSPIRRLGRDIYSFRPGQALSDYLLQLDIVDPAMPKSQRFEINHAPYRLEQSRCFRESGAKLFCLDCHDPHRGTKQVRDVCQECHTSGEHTTAKTDCVSCHMPKRRTQDVVHVVMTDHKIQKPQKPQKPMAGASLLAPREERDPSIAEIIAPPGAELYRTLASARAGKQVTIPPSS